MSENTPYDEKELLLQIAGGDEKSFGDFFYRYAPGVFTVIRKLVKAEEVARDILQEVFIKAWLNRALFHQMENPYSWLLRTGTNMALNFLRDEHTHASIQQALQNSRPLSENNAETAIAAREMHQIIREAVTLLPPQRRRIYELSREQGLDRAEIAITLGISENTVKNQLVIALQSIRDHLAAKGISFFTLLGSFPILFFEGTVQ